MTLDGRVLYFTDAATIRKLLNVIGKERKRRMRGGFYKGNRSSLNLKEPFSLVK
jgi:hypothetical protein